MALTAFVTGADRGLGFALTERMLENGWHVFAGRYMPDWPDLDQLSAQHPEKLIIVPLDVASIDSARRAAEQVAARTDCLGLLINSAGVSSPTNRRGITETQDYDDMHRIYDVNTLGPLRMVEVMLPLLKKSALKRLCFVSSEAGSIGASTRTSWFGYCASKAALNMIVKNLFNKLRPEGYTFRLYHPGWMRTYMSGIKNPNADMEPEKAARYALRYFVGEDLTNPMTPSGWDEDRLQLRDWRGEEWPF